MSLSRGGNRGDYSKREGSTVGEDASYYGSKVDIRRAKPGYKERQGKGCLDGGNPAALEEVVAKAVDDVGGVACGPQKVVTSRTSIGTVTLETGEEPSAEEAQSQALSVANILCVHVLSLLQYLNRKREKCANATTTRFCVEIVCNRTRTKVAAVVAVAVKERKSKSTDARYQVLQKRLSKEVDKRRYSEKASEGLREDVESAKCVIVELMSRLEACRFAYNAESLRVDELTAATEKKEQE
ncbi:hypothetical protein AXG93_1164s1000 [Marchantia polymorpha subsp. ruderalis]|uniref:Uncharacterized protein n=1 Tax=Marchantia polymorpha subsp. ruderalis TaxID=1480154 RepID=A0A176VTX3_MARPO|nr:hypothetical protein AXG93_1164s1000 [Marchantia polymorpha subsp. ruderalis]